MEDSSRPPASPPQRQLECRLLATRDASRVLREPLDPKGLPRNHFSGMWQRSDSRSSTLTYDRCPVFVHAVLLNDPARPWTRYKARRFVASRCASGPGSCQEPGSRRAVWSGSGSGEWSLPRRSALRESSSRAVHGEGRSLQADELDILKENLSPRDFRWIFADHFGNAQPSNLYEVEKSMVEVLLLRTLATSIRRCDSSV